MVGVQNKKMTIKVWEKAFDLLMTNEGGYVNDKQDSGGETKYGISKKTYPDVDIPALTLCQAKEIYRRDYWDACKCDYLPDALSVSVFDFAANSSVKQAVKLLQRSLGVKDDGIMGNQTIGACNSCNIRKVLENFAARKQDFYLKIVERNPKKKKFFDGWTKRVDKTQKVCEQLC